MSVFELAKDWKEAWQDPRVLPARLKDEYRLDSCLKYAREQQVYRLLRTSDNACFLLKVAGDQVGPLLREEYRFLKELSFPFLPKAIDCFEEEDRVYLLREYLPGKTLYEMVEAQGALPPQKAVLLTLSVCQMLHSLHTQKPPLIHRDIKPQNILFSPQGTCFLLDIGSLRQYEPQKSQDTVVVLTQATAAPEQFGFQQSDMRTDVYAVGKLLYYLLTAHFSADEPDLKEVPMSLRSVLRKCLSFSPGKRYQSAANLEKVLRRWLRLRGLRPALRSLAGLFLLGFGLGFGFLVGRLTLPALPADAVLSAETALPAQEPADAVIFVEPGIEEAVRLILGKGNDEPISSRDLGKISEIYIWSDKVYLDAASYQQVADTYWNIQNPKGTISSLEDLLLMPNLETVVLDCQPIWDLEPLTKLPWLEKLSLCECLVRDLKPLARCPWLEELYLRGSPLRDLSPVPEFQNLKVLSIRQTEVTDISALRGMKLDQLDISYLKIEDYSVLSTLSLRRFDAVDLPESAISLLARVPQLEDVGIVLGHYHDLRPFSTSSTLQRLNVALCEIDDFSDMSGFPALYSMDLFKVKLPSLTPLLALPKLERLTLSYATIDDISALPQFTALKEILVDAALAERIAHTFPGVEFPFQIIVDQRSARRPSLVAFGRPHDGGAFFGGGYRDEYL